MLLPALLFVALLPRGYMPDADALRRGDLSLTLCRVVEPRRADINAAPAGDHALPACPFGLLPVLSVPVEPLSLSVPVRWGVASVELVGRLAWKVGVRIDGLGARGPPEA
ncbi:hypothetical protein [Niveispirillum sp. KHB5.9]|uniref:hypothetical protein n=1 Tax=Niveispirillum sp. KHB5.9 TaxID=3400269 RepID=UPI003A87CB29